MRLKDLFRLDKKSSEFTVIISKYKQYMASNANESQYKYIQT